MTKGTNQKPTAAICLHNYIEGFFLYTVKKPCSWILYHHGGVVWKQHPTRVATRHASVITYLGIILSRFITCETSLIIRIDNKNRTSLPWDLGKL